MRRARERAMSAPSLTTRPSLAASGEQRPARAHGPVAMPRMPDTSAPLDATAADNAALLELAEACEMRGDIGLRVDRAPDFFALNRLEGERWRVGIVRGLAANSVAGCVGVSERETYLEGEPTRTMYLGDLKVHPAHRGGPVADALEEYARAACRAAGGDGIPALLTILAGNGAMERRTLGPRGLPVLTRFATIRSHAVPFLWNRRTDVSGCRTAVAHAEDVPEMADLWQWIAPHRQLAPVLDADSLTRWIDAAPGLGIESYVVARDAAGRIVGFLAAWDQSSFKQLRVTSYSARLAAVRAAFNFAARAGNATPLPAAGGQLRCLTAFHICAPGGDPSVLRALLLHVYAARRGEGYSCLNVGLDVRDPLTRALEGLLAQPTDVHAYVTTPAGLYAGPPLDGRPLHYEIALV